MRFSTAVVLTGALSIASATILTSGQIKSRNALKNIMERQFRLCSPVSVPSCSASCGAGYVVCISWPNCYNPTVGATCCSDGSNCRAGYYCTDGGCCPNGTSLSECGATVTLSVIPPPAETPTASPTSSPVTTTTSEAETTTSTYVYTSASISTSTSTSTTTEESSTSAEATTSPEPTPIPLPTPVPSSNGTATTTSFVEVSGNAAAGNVVNAAQVAVGGLGALFMLL